ncbi:MAG: hypothetical protein IH795_00780 [Bacteroidetes bacterium]|nr:hypothetical protein [Bacteroidota bacterium]
MDIMSDTKTNERGFKYQGRADLYGYQYSIQNSSLATDDAIWFGIDDPKPQIMASQAKSLGVETKETTGWIPFPIPAEVLLSTRMHLNREQVAELLPVLQHFVDTGALPD